MKISLCERIGKDYLFHVLPLSKWIIFPYSTMQQYSPIYLCDGVAKTTPVSVGLTGLSVSLSLWLGFSVAEKHKAQSAKQNGTWDGGNRVQASKSLLPEESQMTIFMKRCLPGKLIRDSGPRVFSGGCSLRQSVPTYHIPKVQTPKSKIGIQHKPYCWHK